MSEERAFRKKAFGGFDREDVIEYIDSLLGELKKSREESARKDARIAELERRLEEYEASASVESEVSFSECSSPEDVLAHVDRLLQNYLSREA